MAIKYTKEFILEHIKEYIDDNKKFPTLNQIRKDIGIDWKAIYRYFDGINDVKKELNYEESVNEYIDLRGDFNRSKVECMVANLFVLNGLKDNYKREQRPFPKEEGCYRSDFTFYLGDKELHIEVWGVEKNNNTRERNDSYNKKRKIKESLYEKYGDKAILIGIDYEIFKNTYEEIQRIIIDKLQPYLKLNLKIVDYNLILNYPSMTNDELFKEAMIKAQFKDVLPPVDLIESGIYSEILKRYTSIGNFAQYYNLKTSTGNIEWSKDLVLEYFSKIVEKGIFIDIEAMDSENANLKSALFKNYGSLMELKVEFFKNTGVALIKDEVDYLVNLISNVDNLQLEYVKDKEKLINDAKQILDNLYNEEETTYCKLCGKGFTSNHIYDIYCLHCIDKLKNKEISYITARQGCSHNEKEYVDNFNNITCNRECHMLTMTGFNEASNLKTQAYTIFFDCDWIEVLKIFNRYDDLYNYILSEFKEYISKNNSQNLNTFAKKHRYISQRLVQSIGSDNIYRDLNLIKLRYDDKYYEENFINTVNKIGKIPLYAEFKEYSSIPIETYGVRFKLKGKVYDSVVMMYSSEEDYNEYIIRKKEHKSTLAKINRANQLNKLTSII
jgi:hypothetical protein